MTHSESEIKDFKALVALDHKDAYAQDDALMTDIALAWGEFIDTHMKPALQMDKLYGPFNSIDYGPNSETLCYHINTMTDGNYDSVDDRVVAYMVSLMDAAGLKHDVLINGCITFYPLSN